MIQSASAIIHEVVLDDAIRSIRAMPKISHQNGVLESMPNISHHNGVLGAMPNISHLKGVLGALSHLGEGPLVQQGWLMHGMIRAISFLRRNAYAYGLSRSF